MKALRTAIVLVACFAALLSFVSCEMGGNKAAMTESTGGLGEVTIIATEEKNLDSIIDRNIATWEFMATPLFELASGEYIYGQVFDWRELEAIRTGADGIVKTSTTLGRYTSGNWLFELRCKNKNGSIIAVGSTRQIIREGIDNTVNISLYVDRHDGTHGEAQTNGAMKVGFEVNRLDSSLENMQIVTTYQKVKKDQSLDTTKTAVISWSSIQAGGNLPEWYAGNGSSQVGEGRVYYEGLLNEIEAGPYIFTFKVQGKNTAGSWIDLGGQTVEVMVLGNETTQVKGTLLANEYVVAGLKITAPGKIIGSINGKTYILGTPGNKVTLNYIHDAENSSETPVLYYWHVNGVQAGPNASSSFEFECPKEGDKYLYGIYKVSVVPVGDLGSLGNEVVDIVFNPPTGPNVGEFDWNAALGN